jgi:hypothetical protein
MLALIVALFWLAILAPWAVVKLRNSRSERSIDSFHAEHEVLSRQGYSVAPAHRLDEAYLYEEQAYEPDHEAARSRPRLTVVQENDTYSSLEGRLTWDEWDRDYDYDEPRTIGTHASFNQGNNRYSAYASTPTVSARSYLSTSLPPAGRFAPAPDHSPLPSRSSMRVRRNRIFTSLSLSALFTTALNFLIGLSLLQYLAVLSWSAVVFYVAAAFLAVAMGYLQFSSLVGRGVTRAYPVDRAFEAEDAAPEYYEDDAYYPEEAVYDDRFAREPRRYALG